VLRRWSAGVAKAARQLDARIVARRPGYTALIGGAIRIALTASERNALTSLTASQDHYDRLVAAGTARALRSASYADGTRTRAGACAHGRSRGAPLHGGRCPSRHRRATSTGTTIRAQNDARRPLATERERDPPEYQQHATHDVGGLKGEKMAHKVRRGVSRSASLVALFKRASVQGR